jgi:hypothetical protein
VDQTFLRLVEKVRFQSLLHVSRAKKKGWRVPALGRVVAAHFRGHTGNKPAAQKPDAAVAVQFRRLPTQKRVSRKP